jgi:hypothetical protein
LFCQQLLCLDRIYARHSACAGFSRFPYILVPLFVLKRAMGSGWMRETKSKAKIYKIMP